MKAIIDGITIEGTPAEIDEYSRIQYEKSHSKPFKQVYPIYSRSVDKMQKLPFINDGKCPNDGHACFCTGACNGHKSTVDQMYTLVDQGYSAIRE